MVENQSLVLFNTKKTNKNDLLLSLLHDYSVVYNNIFQIKYCWHLLLRKIHLEFFVLNFFFALISSIYSCYLFHECNLISLVQLVNKRIVPLSNILNQTSALKICNHYKYKLPEKIKIKLKSLLRPTQYQPFLEKLL